MADITKPLQGQPLATSEAPRANVNPGIARLPPSVSIAPDLQALSDGLNAIATSFATKQGTADAAGMVTRDASGQVTRDAQGNIQFAPRPDPLILGPAGLAYQKAFEAGTLADMNNHVRQDLTDINARFPGDPQAFRKEATTYLDNLKGRLGEGTTLGQAAYGHGMDIMSSFYAGQVNALQAANINRDRDAILKQIADARDDALNLAQQGGANTPEFLARMKTMSGFYSQLSGNPVFQFSKDRADLELSQFVAEANGRHISGPGGQIDQAFASGGSTAAQKFVEDNIVDGNLGEHVSQATRAQLASQATARIAYLTGQNKVRVEDSKAVIEAIGSNKISPTDPVVGQVIDLAGQVGDTESKLKIIGVRDEALRRLGLNGLSNAGQAAVMQTGSNHTTSAGYLGALIQQESGGNINAQSETSSANGLYQFTQGTWDVMRRLHPDLNLPATVSQATGAQQTQAVEALTNDNRAQLRRAGIEPNDKNTYLAHFLGAGGAEMLIRAAQQNPNAPAADILPDAANANRKVFYNPDGTPRSVTDVYNLQTRRFSGTSTIPPLSSNGVPYTQQQIDANPALLGAYVQAASRDGEAKIRVGKELADGIINGINKGDQLPSDTNMAMLTQLAHQYPDQLGQKFQDVQATLAGNKLAFAAAQMPGDDGKAFLDRISELSSGSALYDQFVARIAQDAYARRVKALKEDPQGEAYFRGWVKTPPMPLSIADPTQRDAALTHRDNVAIAINTHENVTNTGPFSSGDIEQMKNIALDIPIEQRIATLGAMARNFSAPVYQAGLKQLASNPETQTLAMAGALFADNPEAARGILTGQALLQTEKRYAPDLKYLDAAFVKSLPFTDFPSVPQRAAYIEAAKAHYAYLSAQAGDTTQRLDQTRWDASVKAVTGGVIAFRGSNIQAPWYGATEDQFRAAIQSLAPQDVAGAFTATGQSFPASALQSRAVGTSSPWRLQSAGGAGQYLVFSGDDANRRYLQNAQGDPFILNLSGRKGIEPAIRPIMMPVPVAPRLDLNPRGAEVSGKFPPRPIRPEGNF